jgi:protein SCO1/2
MYDLFMRVRPTAVLFLVGLLLAIAAAACRREPPARRFPLTGQVLAVSSDGKEITIRHDEVPGFMPAMVMPFKVKDRALTSGRLPGDLVKATLAVADEEAWLESLEKTGWAPFPDAAGAEPPASDLVKDGELVPDVTLIDQDGRTFRLSSLRGAPVLLTFIYTRCPLPDFCPRMDRNFQAVQRAVEDGRLPAATKLVSISFDPDFDTPPVLAAHAAQVGANRRTWRFATAPRPQLEAFANRLGLSVIRDEKDPAALTHNLRTAVIDDGGRLVTILNGNGWTPAEAEAAIVRTR